MSEPSKLKRLAWRFFFWITPRWLSRKYEEYMVRRIVEGYPAEVDRKIREALPQEFRATLSEEELAEFSKHTLEMFLHPEAARSARDAFLRSRPHP